MKKLMGHLNFVFWLIVEITFMSPAAAVSATLAPLAAVMYKKSYIRAFCDVYSAMTYWIIVGEGNKITFREWNDYCSAKIM